MNKYLDWHYNIVFPKLFKIFSNLFIFPIYYFSVPLHLKTLFSPFKRQITAKKRGFNLNDVIGVISFNITSRIIGFILRGSFIFYGLAFSVLFPLFFLPIIFIWPLIPGLTYFFYLNRPDPVKSREIFLKKRLPEFPLAKEEDIAACDTWYQSLEKQKDDMLLLSKERIKAITGIGTDWAYGYTVTLDKYSKDLTREPMPYPFLLGRDKEIKEIERTLLKTENNNVLVIGNPGIGRHILISTLAHNLFMGKCDPSLAHKRIVHLDMHSLFTDSANDEKLKSLFSLLLEESQIAGNINIYIDNIDKYTSGGQGRVDLTDVIEKFTKSRVGVIGTTTPDNFHDYIEPNETLNKIFTEIILVQPAASEVLTELELSIVPVLERKYRVSITFQSLKKVLEDSDRFITTSPFPGKAIELLEEAVIWKMDKEKNSYLTSSDIDGYLSQKLNLPLGDLNKNESETLLNLEDFLHQRVINQHQAIRLIAGSLRRSRLSISSTQKPIASFLFLGPTGVGKTETAKALSEAYFKSKDEFIRFDMAEFQGEEGLIRLIGSKTFNKSGELTSRLREKPYGVVLFDEIEKAPSMILNLFLTLLDEGYITDGMGKKVNCKNTIIIATSNAGAEFIRESVINGIKDGELSKKVIDFVLEKGLFSPEFVNRFDSAVVYTPLSEGQLKEVAKIMLKNLNARLGKRELSVDINETLINHLAGLGSNLEFGARSIRREIETNIEDQIAQKVLKGNLDKSKPIQIEL